MPGEEQVTTAPEALLNCSSELSCLGLGIKREGINFFSGSPLSWREEGQAEDLEGDAAPLSALGLSLAQLPTSHFHPLSAQGAHSL